MNSNKASILVSGGDGQLGKSFKKLNLDNLVIKNRSELDICNVDQIRQVFESQEFSFVINCAAYTQVDKAESEIELCRQVNVEGVRNLATVAKQYDCKVIHISSDYVYYPDHSLAIDENEDCYPKGVYAQSKYDGEQVLSSVDKNNIVIRTSWVYSEFGHNFVKTMLHLGKERAELNVVDDQIGSPTYASDIAEAIMAIIDKPFSPGIYNYSNLGFISWADFARAIFAYSDIATKVNAINTEQYPTPAPRPRNSRLIKSKIADTFAINLKHWRTSLEKCLAEIDNRMV